MSFLKNIRNFETESIKCVLVCLCMYMCNTSVKFCVKILFQQLLRKKSINFMGYFILPHPVQAIC